MKLVIKKSDYTGKLQDLMNRRGDKPEDKLERFRKLILDHLSKQEDENEGGEVSKIMQKALNFVDKLAKGGKGLPVGTVREWGGKKYVKVSMGSGKIPGKWRIKYDSQTRGAKMAVSAIKRKIAAARDAQEMLQIVLENRDRFSDQHGQPLPFVMELSEYVGAEQERRGQAEKAAAGEKPKKKGNQNAKKDGGGGDNGDDGKGKPRRNDKPLTADDLTFSEDDDGTIVKDGKGETIARIKNGQVFLPGDQPKLSEDEMNGLRSPYRTHTDTANKRIGWSGNIPIQ